MEMEENLTADIEEFFRHNVPFSQTVNIQIVHVTRRQAHLQLPATPSNLNHINTLHAGALFTLAEATSGAVVLGTFREYFSLVVPLVTQATISFKKIAQETVEAHAAIPMELQEQVLAVLKAPQGRLQFPVAVRLTIQGTTRLVAEAKFHWYVRKSAR